MIKNSFKVLTVIFLVISALGLCIGVYCQDVNPNENSWLPFFGLAFPMLLWTNVIAIVLLFIKKKVYLIIPLVAIVYAWPSINNYYQLFAKTEFSEAAIDELKMMSYNVRIFDVNENIGGGMKDSIFSMLGRQDVNLICFQEFYYAEKKGLFDTKSIVIEDLELGNAHENYTHHMREGLHSGVATFTSFPILNKGVINFETDINNSCIYTDIIISPDTIRVYNAHLSSIRFKNQDYALVNGENGSENEEVSDYTRIYGLLEEAYKKRALQLQKVLDHISECPYPVVLAGDFNDTPVSYCYNQTKKYLTDSFVESGFGVGNTYIGKLPSFRIDYIFHSGEIESAGFRTLPEEFSDHRAIYTKLRIKPQ